LEVKLLNPSRREPEARVRFARSDNRIREASERLRSVLFSNRILPFPDMETL
jgi:hypothetical protein